MLIILCILAIIVGFVVTAIVTGDEEYFFPAGSIAVVLGIIFFGAAMNSYTTYLDNRAFYDATVNQYRDQITLYKNEAQIDIKAVSYTDFKYQGYQKEMAENIRVLTKGVANYNRGIIQKRILKKNAIFSWFITAPDDDMVTISLIERKK